MHAQNLETLGFSLPTIARLKANGVGTVAELVAREESITAELIKEKCGEPKPPSRPSVSRELRTLPISTHMRGCLNNANLGTVKNLLDQTAEDVRKYRSFGYRSLAKLFVCLIDEGYSENDGLFLSKDSVVPLLIRAELIKELQELDAKSSLSEAFKLWFNRMMNNPPELPYRPNRKFFPEPFKIGKKKK